MTAEEKNIHLYAMMLRKQLMKKGGFDIDYSAKYEFLITFEKTIKDDRIEP